MQSTIGAAAMALAALTGCKRHGYPGSQTAIGGVTGHEVSKH
ncbi:hypothetical protein [Polaromonas sp. YR568]